MVTRILPADKTGVRLAAKLLGEGEVVAIPTETVYGLAASAFDGAAVHRIFEAKGRPQDNPLICHIADMAMLPALAREIPESAYALADAFWPGPLTMVLPRTDRVAPEVAAGLDSVGVRMPKHPAALAVVRAAGVPLAAPSANRSGSPSPTTAAHVLQDMEGRIPLVLDGGSCEVGVESTVLSLVGRPTILRPGFVTQEDIGAVLGEKVDMAEAVTAPLEDGAEAASPGMKYKHYAPEANVVLLEGDLPAFARYAGANGGQGVYALCFAGEEEKIPLPCVPYGGQQDEAAQATALFAALRRLDELGAKTVYARMPKKNGVGLAVYNRLLRAAGFRVVKL